MTFDARDSSKSSGGNNLVFGAITVVIMSAAFFAVLNLPTSGPDLRAETDASEPAERIVAIMDADPAFHHPGLSTNPAKAYLATLRRIDPEASKRLDAKLASTRHDKQADVTLVHAADVLKTHAKTLALANTHHVDTWLDMTRDGLRRASHKNHEWCAGSRYTALAELDHTSPDAIAYELSGLEAELNDYAFTSLNHFLLAIEDARKNPVQRGPVIPRDEAALQGVVMSMVSDPQVLPLIMSAQAGGSPEDAMKSVNVCELAATAVTAVKTLPQDTKGRVFAEIVKKARFDKSDLNAVGGFSGF